MFYNMPSCQKTSLSLPNIQLLKAYKLHAFTTCRTCLKSTCLDYPSFHWLPLNSTHFNAYQLWFVEVTSLFWNRVVPVKTKLKHLLRWWDRSDHRRKLKYTKSPMFFESRRELISAGSQHLDKSIVTMHQARVMKIDEEWSWVVINWLCYVFVDEGFENANVVPHHATMNDICRVSE